jgi:hypothetical protein
VHPQRHAVYWGLAWSGRTIESSSVWEDACSELGIANEPHVRPRLARIMVTQHDRGGVEAEGRDLCS